MNSWKKPYYFKDNIGTVLLVTKDNLNPESSYYEYPKKLFIVSEESKPKEDDPEIPKSAKDSRETLYGKSPSKNDDTTGVIVGVTVGILCCVACCIAKCICGKEDQAEGAEVEEEAEKEEEEVSGVDDVKPSDQEPTQIPMVQPT